MHVIVMAVACALAIACLYYPQPILPLIAHTFGVQHSTASLVVTFGQLGYALGLFLVVPVGDKVNRKKLILSLLTVNTFCLAACVAAPNFLTFSIAIIAAGLTTVTPQIIIPTITGAAAPKVRGRTVGALLSGMSAGLLLGRVGAGFIGDLAGWRSVFAFAIPLNGGLFLLICRFFPATVPTTRISYPRPLKSVLQLLVEEKMLRAACMAGFLALGCFSALWATLSPLLAQPPHSLPSRVAGLFGLVGLASIIGAPILGRLTDRVGATFSIYAGFVLLFATYVTVDFGRIALWPIIVAVVCLDVGYRCVFIANQTWIYSLRADAHSRLNTAFTTSAFLGAAAGSAISAYGVSFGSWHGLAAVGAALATAGFLFHLYVTLKSKKAIG